MSYLLFELIYGYYKQIVFNLISISLFFYIFYLHFQICLLTVVFSLRYYIKILLFVDNLYLIFAGVICILAASFIFLFNFSFTTFEALTRKQTNPILETQQIVEKITDQIFFKTWVVSGVQIWDLLELFLQTGSPVQPETFFILATLLLFQSGAQLRIVARGRGVNFQNLLTHLIHIQPHS